MFLVSRPSKRFSTSSLRSQRAGSSENKNRGGCHLPRGSHSPLSAAGSRSGKQPGRRGTHSFMLRVSEMSSSLEKSRIRKW